MDVFSPNQSIVGQMDIFDDVSQEIRFVLKKDGTILYKNEVATGLLSTISNFFSTLHKAEWMRGMSFFKEMEEMGQRCERTFIHVIDGVDHSVFYRGIYRNERFYLTGTERPFHSKEVMGDFTNRLPLGFIKVNAELKIIEKNRTFLEFALPKLEQGTIAELGFERLRLESEAGACIYKAVKEAFRSQSISEQLEEDREAGRLFRSLAVYVPASEEVIGLLFDESTDIKYEQLLQYKQQMESVSHLAAGVAHELRNPLSVIRGFLQLSELTNSFEKYAKTIFGEVDRMNKILENFLSISRKKFDVHALSPMEVIDTVEDIIRSECLLNNVHFEASIAKTERLLKMNETMIKQVILNLLRNSMEAYTQEQHKVFSLITCEHPEDYEITVKDNGPGIPEEILDKIGEPFNTSKDKGTGIGISLSKKIIEDHHGTFHVESEKNKGTAIIITLPFP
ncbi:two-component system sensor histidine kinase NtrB [Salicibibacter kimchii]|uniref:histidine kinase n=1 Tax=Salicibibacter kimchii TaxID=2099786 RepID=A0A345BUT2_9BACI|nr:HAMP domain-containing sensor histidine kinase [Salicibibacter kimchii]AXF54713.1 sensor histidine kinase [Salicibibacter kimchii]